MKPKYYRLFFSFLLVFILSAEAEASTWNLHFSDPQFQNELDRLTLSKRSLNKIDWLHLGKNSLQHRRSDLKSAQFFIFQTVPFWMRDSVADEFVDIFKGHLAQNRDFDLRLTFDWASPFLSKDPLKLQQFRELEELLGSGMYYWNNPNWQMPWSNQLLENRIHEKLLLVDGKILYMGGMNVGQNYLLGGLSEVGWRDEDVRIEGPIVQEVTEHSLRFQHLIRHLSEHRQMPERATQIIELLKSWLRPLTFGSRHQDTIRKVGLWKKFQEDLQKVQSRIQPYDPIERGRQARWIYTNPLIDLDANRNAVDSRLFETLQFLFSKAQKSVRVYLPYMSLTDRMESLFAQTAQRGIRIEIITNSEASNDVEHSYFAGLYHYLTFLNAGIQIYEWQGHQERHLLKAEFECEVGPWPGRTLHSKVLLIDDAITLIGSHNFNARSELYNSESVLLVEGHEFNLPFQRLFNQDTFSTYTKSMKCSDQFRKPIPIAKKVGKFKAEIMVKENQGKINTARGLLKYL